MIQRGKFMESLKEFFAVPGVFEPRNYAWFGLEHDLWLLAILVIGLFTVYLYRNMNPNQRMRFLRIFAACIVLSEVARQLIYGLQGAYRLEYMPLHLCAVTELACLIYAFKRDAVSREFMYWIGLPGALAALLFPDWLQIPLWNFQSIHSFGVHGAMTIFAILLLAGGESRPKIKGAAWTMGLMALLALPLFFLNKLWDTNFFFLN
ncbi:MAG: hypothetical protein E4G74_01615 [Erysipelotrichales bacterium]|nr:MAG: hypothetical protein E4G74_01615 [Erysipelotrichales bacterium]